MLPLVRITVLAYKPVTRKRKKAAILAAMAYLSPVY